MIRKWFAQFFKTENLAENAKTGNFSKEEFAKIEAACQKDLKMSFIDALSKMQQEDAQVVAFDESHRALLATINAGTSEQAQQAAASVSDPQAAQAAVTVATQRQTIDTQAAQIVALSKEPEYANSKKVKATTKVIPIKGGAHTPKHVFGIEAAFFAIENKPWNAVAATGQPLEVIAATMGFSNKWKKYETELKNEIDAYGESLASRIEALHAQGTLGSLTMQGIDFTGFDGTGWGEEYIVRRQDTIITYIRTLNSVSGIFPVRYGVQHKEELTNSFLTSFSSGFLAGRNFKGKSAVQPIEAFVSDVMIKHKFSDLKKLEKEYIGYYNREGSDPMKWTWIEWMMVNILKAAMNEWNERRILGYAITPKESFYNHHLHGSNGVIRTIWLWAEDLRLKPLTGYNYTKSTVLTSIEGVVEFLNTKLPTLTGLRVGINNKHIPWYNAAYSKEYSLRQDYTGVKPKVMNYEEVEIIGIPNMGNSTMMIITMPGNIELIENKPGEMSGFYTQRDLEELMIVSQWKEGVSAYMVGLKQANAAALEADDYQNQYIFFTDDTVGLVADATSVDATKGLRFQTVANALATAITDFVGAKPGLVYRVTNGSLVNDSTIAKAAKFSELTAAYIPTAVGDYLEFYLYKNPDNTADALNGKFIEVARKVTV